jgi:nicotinamidase-related amidase
MQIPHMCVEATVRYTAELGYGIMMVKEATSDYLDFTESTVCLTKSILAAAIS